jgi:hypothetical protein
MMSCSDQRAGWPEGIRTLSAILLFLFFSWPYLAPAQTATIADAWWTYQQDCNGDGCQAGTLMGERARLNWNPDVNDCNGSISVFEIVYFRPCGATSWLPLYTNSSHIITGCRGSDAQFVDVVMVNGCACRDYQIEIYRDGEMTPDDVRSSAQDPDLAGHREQLLAEDFCLNDLFSACAAISGTFGSRIDNNSGAGKERGEPDHAGNSGGKSLWYCWTASTNTDVTFDTIGSAFDTLLAVYVGDSVSNLLLVASNDDIAGASDRHSRLTFTPAPGTTYHLAVDGYGGAAGALTLNWNQSGAALPDLIIWPDAVSPIIITRTFTNSDCEVVEGCEIPGTRRLLSFTTETRNIGAGDLLLGDPSTNSLFHWASCHAHYHFEEFAQYDLLDTNGQAVAFGHKVGFCLEDVRPWSTTANPQIKYHCNFQGIQAGWTDVYAAGLPCQYIDITDVLPGNYTLRLAVNPAGLLPESDTNNNVAFVPVTIPPPDCPAAPSNDNFSTGLNLVSSPFSFQEFNECASTEPGEPPHAGDPGGHSVWFDWSPISDGVAVITTKRSDFDTLLAVYTGDSLTNLTLIASNDDVIRGIYLQSEVSLPAFAGTNYHIAVDGWGGAVGTVVLNLNPPPNDDFADAQEIMASSGAVTGYTVGASKEPYEPAHAYDVGGHSVWFVWTAPADGPVEFNTTGSAFDTTLAVYTGDVLTNLIVVAANNDASAGLASSRLAFVAAAGSIYRIAVDGFAGESGSFKLNWNMDAQLSIARLAAGPARVSFTGVNDQRYAILVSTNLETWSTQTTRTMSGGLQQMDDNSGVPCRFFRAMLLPY